MQTFLGIETEVEHRRREYAREAAADARAAHVRPQNGRIRGSQLRHWVVARLRALATPRLALAPLHPSPIAMHHAHPSRLGEGGAG
jgi:hypothetical protein